MPSDIAYFDFNEVCSVKFSLKIPKLDSVWNKKDEKSIRDYTVFEIAIRKEGTEISMHKKNGPDYIVTLEDLYKDFVEI